MRHATVYYVIVKTYAFAVPFIRRSQARLGINLKPFIGWAWCRNAREEWLKMCLPQKKPLNNQTETLGLRDTKIKVRTSKTGHSAHRWLRPQLIAKKRRFILCFVHWIAVSFIWHTQDFGYTSQWGFRQGLPLELMHLGLIHQPVLYCNVLLNIVCSSRVKERTNDWLDVLCLFLKLNWMALKKGRFVNSCQ